MNALFSVTKTIQVPVDIMFNLFDSFIAPILNYSCEIWGFSRAENIARVHRKFCKWLINVKISTNNLSLAGELGRFPLFIGRHIRIIKYWLNLHNTKNVNCILRTLNLNQRDEALKIRIFQIGHQKLRTLLKSVVFLMYGYIQNQSLPASLSLFFNVD